MNSGNCLRVLAAVRPVAFLVFVLAASRGRAAEGEVATIRTVDDDGRPMVASLRSIANGDMSLLADRPVSLRVADVIRVDFGRRRLGMSHASLLCLANGDRIVAGLASMTDEAIVVLWKSYPDWPPIRVPAEAIAGFLLSVPEGAMERTRAFRGVFGRRQKSDVVLLQNGDRVAGELASFDQAVVNLLQGGKKLQIEMPRVRGLSFNSDLTSLASPKKPRAQVTLTDGSILTGSDLVRVPDGPLRMTTGFGAQLELPLRSIASIRFLDGRAIYLSDLEPQTVRQVGFFGAHEDPPLRKNANAAGGPLRVRGREYSNGLGTRSRCEMTFALRGQYRRFQSLAGLDDLAGPGGSVRFTVDADGARLFASGPVTGATDPVVIGPIDVTGRRQLTLIVDYGELADVDDWADWCESLVTR